MQSGGTSSSTNSSDVRRPAKVIRYKPVDSSATPEDPTPEYMNVLGMIFSMCGLMMRLKWCAWVALFCSCVSFANGRTNDDAKQVLSSFMLAFFIYHITKYFVPFFIKLSISAVVMCYLQNPAPIVPIWSSLT